LEPQEKQQAIFTINSRTQEPEEKTRDIVSQGRVEICVEEEMDQSLDLAAIQARCQHFSLSASECYRHYYEMGISYGPALQGIEQLRVGEGEVLARLRLPGTLGATQTHTDGSQPHPYVLHPSLLDSALQACIGLLHLSAEPQKPWVPFALDEVCIMHELPAQAWAWVRTAGTPTGAKGEGSVFDIDVCDDAGQVAVLLRGLRSRPLQGEEESRTVLMIPNWREETISSLHASEPFPLSVVTATGPRPLVLLCDLPGLLAAHIQAQLGEGGLCRNLSVGTGVNPTPQAPVRQPHPEQRFQDMVFQLIQELQSLLQSRPTGSVLVQVVVADIEQPSRLSALAGVLKTAQQEYPKLLAQLIEIEGEPEEGELLRWLRENQLRPHEPHVSYRNGKRWVRQWQHHSEVTAPTALPWKEGGCYLITGGAGGLARLFV
jgi:polyketide synthase PksN